MRLSVLDASVSALKNPCVRCVRAAAHTYRFSLINGSQQFLLSSFHLLLLEHDRLELLHLIRFGGFCLLHGKGFVRLGAKQKGKHRDVVMTLNTSSAERADWSLKILSLYCEPARQRSAIAMTEAIPDATVRKRPLEDAIWPGECLYFGQLDLRLSIYSFCLLCVPAGLLKRSGGSSF
jgi:hypothetical protein